MLESLYIKNFRLFKELKIEHLGRVNLIVGRNNSGKTCLLEALWIYGSYADQAVLKKIIYQRDEDWDDKSNEFRFYYNDNENIIISPLQNGKKNWPTIELSIEKPNWLNSYGYEDFQKNTQFVSTTMADQPVENLWNNIFVTPLEEYVLKGLRLFDQKIEKVGLIVKPDKNIPMIFLKNERIPLKHLGEGISRVFHIILALVNAKDSFLLIDEFENGLHYTVQPKVWELIFKLAKDLNVQVFATTHSWDCVTTFIETTQANETEGMLFNLGRSALKSNENKVIATAYDKDELELVTQADLEVR
ncbi:MAG: AAA family ATPase [Pseudomonadota bacterium]